MKATGMFLLSLLFAGALGLKQRHHPALTSSSKLGDQGSKPVFYCIIMGKLAFRHQVSLWLSSVRKLGGFKDEVVIVTDKPTCLAKTLSEAKLLGGQISSDENVDIYNPGEGYSGNIHIVKRPTVKSINKMKLEKARAWRNMQVAAVPHPVSSIVYTDEDVVIGKDLTEFMGLVRELEPAKHTLALFRDTGLSKGELHTGVVIIFPGAHTEQCLQAWGKKLTGVQIGSADTEANPQVEEGAKLKIKVGADLDEDVKEEADIREGQLTSEEIVAMGPDQQALHATKQCKKTPDHDGIKILPKNFFWLPTSGGMHKNKQYEFVHFTNTGRWKRISNTDIKNYLLAIGIPAHIDPLGHVNDKECAAQADKM